MILHIFDVSQYIAAGAVRDDTYCGGVTEDNGLYRSRQIPVGGVKFLLNTIYDFYKPGNELVFVFDDVPYVKREMHERAFPTLGGYKGKRPRKLPKVVLQRDLAYEVLKMCGFNCIKVEGYEADDCIATLVEEYKDSYDHVYLHNRDSDLFYLVEDNVSIAPVGNQGKYITLANYEQSVSSKWNIKYNTVLLSKLYDGDASDNIPKISPDMVELIERYISEEKYRLCGNKNLLRSWVAEATNNDKVTMSIVDLILTLDVPKSQIQLCCSKFEQDCFNFFAGSFGHRKAPKQFLEISECNDLLESFIEKYERGDYM